MGRLVLRWACALQDLKVLPKRVVRVLQNVIVLQLAETQFLVSVTEEVRTPGPV